MYNEVKLPQHPSVNAHDTGPSQVWLHICGTLCYSTEALTALSLSGFTLQVLSSSADVAGAQTGQHDETVLHTNNHPMATHAATDAVLTTPTQLEPVMYPMTAQHEAAKRTYDCSTASAHATLDAILATPAQPAQLRRLTPHHSPQRGHRHVQLSGAYAHHANTGSQVWEPSACHSALHEPALSLPSLSQVNLVLCVLVTSTWSLMPDEIVSFWPIAEIGKCMMQASY